MEMKSWRLFISWKDVNSFEKLMERKLSKIMLAIKILKEMLAY